VPSSVVPEWLQIAAAAGDAGGMVAALSAIVALMVWQYQRRKERRREIAERAIVAVHLFCDELTELSIEVDALVSASLDRLDSDDTERYLRELEHVRMSWRERSKSALRDLEVVLIQARTLLPREYHWVQSAMMAYRFANSGISLHSMYVRREWLSDNALKAIQPARELNTEVKKARDRVLARLGPIARFEEPGRLIKAWRKLQREMDEHCERDFRVGSDVGTREGTEQPPSSAEGTSR
jgi:hypothetical protein